MRLAILSAPACRVVTGAWMNGAHPEALPLLLADRIGNGEAFDGERVVRLPRRFGRMYLYQVNREIGKAVDWTTIRSDLRAER